jgi:hypothetical protein
VPSARVRAVAKAACILATIGVVLLVVVIALAVVIIVVAIYGHGPLLGRSAFLPFRLRACPRMRIWW